MILDADLARLYGVTTKRFNEAFKRNRQRFPQDFAFQLTTGEFNNLRSQFATSSPQAIDFHRVDTNRAHTVAGSHGGRRYNPWAFTEHGALMAANILRSEPAVHMSVFVIRAFVRLREQLAANATILKRLAEIDRTLLQHDSALFYCRSFNLSRISPSGASGLIEITNDYVEAEVRMGKPTRQLTEAEEMAQRLCDSVAGSVTYILNGHPQMQVEVLRNLLADLAGKGGDWRRIYGFIYNPGIPVGPSFRTLTLWRT